MILNVSRQEVEAKYNNLTSQRSEGAAAGAAEREGHKGNGGTFTDCMTEL